MPEQLPPAPEGYVLVPKDVYDLLLKQATPKEDSAKARKPIETTIYLQVLQAIHLGDIKTQVNPDEIVEWIPRRSITIRGKINSELGSFLSVFNKQSPGHSRYDPAFPPVFVVSPESQEDFAKVLGYGNITGRAAAGGLSEKDRIQGEETLSPRSKKVKVAAGLEFDTTPQPTAEDLQEFDDDYQARLHGELPPRGSAERKEMIHKGNIERMNAPGQKVAGLNSGDGADLSVEDFPVQQNTQSDQRVVAQVPLTQDGEAAEATIPPRTGTRTATRRPKIKRRR